MSLESQVEASNVQESCIAEVCSRYQLAKTTIDSIVNLALNPQRAFEFLDRGLMLKCV